MKLKIFLYLFLLIIGNQVCAKVNAEKILEERVADTLAQLDADAKKDITALYALMQLLDAAKNQTGENDNSCPFYEFDTESFNILLTYGLLAEKCNAYRCGYCIKPLMLQYIRNHNAEEIFQEKIHDILETFAKEAATDINKAYALAQLAHAHEKGYPCLNIFRKDGLVKCSSDESCYVKPLMKKYIRDYFEKTQE